MRSMQSPTYFFMVQPIPSHRNLFVACACQHHSYHSNFPVFIHYCWLLYPLVIQHTDSLIAIEHGHKHSEFSQWKLWIFPLLLHMLVYQRVLTTIDHDQPLLITVVLYAKHRARQVFLLLPVEGEWSSLGEHRWMDSWRLGDQLYLNSF